VPSFLNRPVRSLESDKPGNPSAIITSDGLSLFQRPDGRIISVTLDGDPVGSDSPISGFLARDVAAGTDYHLFRHKSAPIDLSTDVTLTGGGSAIRVEGSIRDVSGFDRAVTFAFALPLGDGWTWHSRIRESHGIDKSRHYTNTTDIGAGDGGMSLYPWAAVSKGDAGIAIGLDMEKPAHFRLGFDGPSGTLYITYDFGLSPYTANFPKRADFAFVIYRFDPEWGFRSATKAYYDLFPDHFVNRSTDQGIWMPFTNISTVEGWEDFGFKYKEGASETAFDDTAGVLTFRYTEPSTWWMRMAKDLPRTHRSVMQAMGQAAESDDDNIRRRALGTQISGSHDIQGRFQYLVRDEPWCDGAVFSSNPSPYLPGQSEARIKWNDEQKKQLYGPNAEGDQDGEYLDSLEAYVTAATNHRRDHFAHTTLPLTFDSELHVPVIHKAFSIYEFTKWISDDLHGMGKLLFCNSVPNRFAFLTPWIDVMGTEMNWNRNGVWKPAGDDWMLYRRTICYQRPFLFLQNTHYDAFGSDLVEKYFQRSLFYGMYPSMFSHNAAEDPYWKNPKMYNRDRPLFVKYLPIIKQIAEAGWEPVTHAQSDNPNIYVERYGPDDDGRTYIAVLNDSQEAVESSVRVDTSALSVSGSNIAEILSGELVQVIDNTEIRFSLGPEEAKVFQLE